MIILKLIHSDFIPSQSRQHGLLNYATVPETNQKWPPKLHRRIKTLQQRQANPPTSYLGSQLANTIHMQFSLKGSNTIKVIQKGTEVTVSCHRVTLIMIYQRYSTLAFSLPPNEDDQPYIIATQHGKRLARQRNK